MSRDDDDLEEFGLRGANRAEASTRKQITRVTFVGKSDYSLPIPMFAASVQVVVNPSTDIELSFLDSRGSTVSMLRLNGSTIAPILITSAYRYVKVERKAGGGDVKLLWEFTL